MNNFTNIDGPLVLYKYKDVSGNKIEQVEDMFRNNRVWFSSPMNFNDPFDCRCVYDIGNSREEIVLRKAEFLERKGISSSEAITQAEHDIPQSPEEIEKWQKQQIDGHSRRAANTGIFCLTQNCDNPIMWMHYANGHKGICIVFRVQDMRDASHIDFFARALSIEYVERCPLINFIRDDSIEIVKKAFLTKATPYSYEAEWRIVRYDDGPGLKSIPKGIIRGIIFGVQIDSTTKQRIVKVCAEYDGDIEIFQATLDPEKYGLKINFEKTI